MTSNDIVPELTKSQFDDYISEGLVFIDFFADWCMPCLMMSPIIDELAEKFKGQIKFGKVNVEDNQELSQKFEIVSIPNMIFFKDGEIIERFVGGMSSEDLEEKLKNFLK